MRLTFRQGIARYQTDVYATPTFLRKSALDGQFIDLIVSPDPTIVIFAHRNSTYVVEESKTVPNAWGPFPVGSATKYLYWDVNLLDASLTRGFTPLPLIIGAAPTSPAIDQHWYDTAIAQMKVWNGSKWVDKLRVFSATYSSTGIIQPPPLGTQVGATGTFEAGNLVLDAFNKPLRQSDGSFVTSATPMTIVNAASKAVKFEAEVFSGMAQEYLPKYHFVQARPNSRLILARSDDWKSRVIGLVTEDLFQSEVGTIITYGLVRNEQWSWPPASVGRPIFCGATGEITLEPPQVGVNQVSGYVYDVDSIVINIQHPTILDDITAQPLVTPISQILTPISDFSVSATTGTVPFVVKFMSTALHNPTSLEWDIGNNGTIDGTGPEFTFTFTSVGTYAVRLRAISNAGMDDEIKTDLINVSPMAAVGTKTNLSIQLGGPLQVSSGQIFTVSVTTNNDGLKNATQVARTITIEDMGDFQILVSGLPAGSTTSRVAMSLVIALPITPLVTGQYANSAFTITAPSGTGTIKLRASVGSPETDSTLGDNVAELSIKVK